MHSVWYQGKVGEYFFPELLVVHTINTSIMVYTTLQVPCCAKLNWEMLWPILHCIHRIACLEMMDTYDTISELWNISHCISQLSPVSTDSLLWGRAAPIVSLASKLSSNCKQSCPVQQNLWRSRVWSANLLIYTLRYSQWAKWIIYVLVTEKHRLKPFETLFDRTTLKLLVLWLLLIWPATEMQQAIGIVGLLFIPELGLTLGFVGSAIHYRFLLNIRLCCVEIYGISLLLFCCRNTKWFTRKM
jgi:hypothetical protein